MNAKRSISLASLLLELKIIGTGPIITKPPASVSALVSEDRNAASNIPIIDKTTPNITMTKPSEKSSGSIARLHQEKFQESLIKT